MDLSKLAYLVILTAIAYAPYKYLQRFGGLLQLSSANAIFIATIMSICTGLLLIDVQRSEISINVFLMVAFVTVIAMWIAAPQVLPHIGMYPQKSVAPPHNINIASAHPPLFYLKCIEILLQEVIFLYIILVVMRGYSPIDKVLWFTGTLVALHGINILFTRNLRVSLLLVLLSIPMGLLFGNLIVYGYAILCLVIHMGFYLALTTYLWSNKRFA